MVPFASKGLWALGILTGIAALTYGWTTNDDSGGVLLAFLAGGAIILAVAVAVADADQAPWYVPGAPVASQPPVGGRPLLPAAWPLFAAVSLAVLALGAASDAGVVIIAGVLMAVAGVGWAFQSWAENPVYTARYAHRLRDRLVIPVGLPILVLALIAIITISLSRIFLALPEDGTRIVALVVAAVALISGFVIAASDRMARTALLLLIGFAFACLLGAAIASIAHGERHFEQPTKPVPHAPLPPGIDPSVTATTAVP
ncbi:MAG TPA: hypothetical protein VMU14_05680 [Acidimicrobiales bacterium]|nr:hypothetical protein [Acidimicrobiales bacterium]